jgi:hypothetical protein
MADEWIPTGGQDWRTMTRQDFDAEMPLVLFEAVGTRQSRKQAQAPKPADLFSLDDPADE